MTGLEITSQVTLAEGDPELVHLMVDVTTGHERVGYQVPVGVRAALPAALEPARIGALPDGRVAYDAMADPALTALLLRGIAEDHSAGPLRFRSEPGAVVDASAQARALPPLASNTSVVFGDKAILKLLRTAVRRRPPRPRGAGRAGAERLEAGRSAARLD